MKQHEITELALQCGYISIKGKEPTNPIDTETARQKVEESPELKKQMRLFLKLLRSQRQQSGLN